MIMKLFPVCKNGCTKLWTNQKKSSKNNKDLSIHGNSEKT